MNKTLLRRIQAAILAEPDAFRMDEWSCGTAHCIAGWAVHLNGLTMTGDLGAALSDGRVTEAVANELLGLSEEEGYALTAVHEWPNAFAVRYEVTKSRAERASIAAERIDHFIQTNGAE